MIEGLVRAGYLELDIYVAIEERARATHHPRNDQESECSKEPAHFAHKTDPAMVDAIIRQFIVS